MPGSSPPSSVGAVPPSPADEDDGLPEFAWPLSDFEEDWPGSFGAARLGIP
jgi:hypothetical protein